MAKTSSINRNDKRRALSKRFDSKRKRLKAIVMKKDTSMEERFKAALTLAEMPRNSAKNRIRNRCELTGRPRSVYRKLRLSRIALREMANSGLIPGMVKSSW
ncbi:MAG: 30S ribosomal protein S14 [Aestuariivirga sp.]